jgi:hypothetical protein
MSKAKDFYLNELSLEKVDNKEQAQEVVAIFTKSAAALRQYGLGSLRHSEILNLKNVEIAENYFIYTWLSDHSVDAELRRRFKGIVTQAPILRESDSKLLEKSGRTDVYYDTKQALGMTAAYNDDSITLSFGSSEQWNTAHISAVFISIEDEAINEKVVTIRNITSITDFIEHIIWIKNSVDLTKIKQHEPLVFTIVSDDFIEKQGGIEGLGTEEKIAYYKEVFKVIATLNFYEYNADITKKNNRLVFEFGEGSSKIYLALDTQHGSIECHNHQGVHKGEYNFRGVFQKNSTHVLDVK